MLHTECHNWLNYNFPLQERERERELGTPAVGNSVFCQQAFRPLCDILKNTPRIPYEQILEAYVYVGFKEH